MWRLALVILTGGLLTLSDALRTDLDMIQGTWTVVRHRRFLEKDRPRKQTLFVFDGNNLIVKADSNETRSTFKIDSSTKPKRFDLQGKIWNLPVAIFGCYRLSGDGLIIRLNEQGGRPPGFSSSQLEAGQSELVLIRKNPGK